MTQIVCSICGSCSSFCPNGAKMPSHTLKGFVHWTSREVICMDGCACTCVAMRKAWLWWMESCPVPLGSLVRQRAAAGHLCMMQHAGGWRPGQHFLCRCPFYPQSSFFHVCSLTLSQDLLLFLLLISNMGAGCVCLAWFHHQLQTNSSISLVLDCYTPGFTAHNWHWTGSFTLYVSWSICSKPVDGNTPDSLKILFTV